MKIKTKTKYDINQEVYYIGRDEKISTKVVIKKSTVANIKVCTSVKDGGIVDQSITYVLNDHSNDRHEKDLFKSEKRAALSLVKLGK